ncbi:uncharacterized protein F4812DRAFT_440782 [Daldinia caldariorum]|uniref:uncharacterized protein n=1 Tax=Daldinia caldariorum TaxID=326644 RepID=UPI002008B3E2|nr:uncharacterized protein F4812DRAFT_440782 [Daldinia caldariorum]KAI1464871.1 hypothetical protein F4812DRAFT_440782 [Daldinia caldariorum]
MPHQPRLPSPTNTTSLRRSSIASEKTLVDTPSQIEDATKEKSQESKKYHKPPPSVKAEARNSWLPVKMGEAVEKVKLKLRENDSKSKPRGRQPVRDGYPDTRYMWQALAETKL